LSNGVGDGVERSGRSLSDEAFEFREDLLDWIEVGRVFGKEQERRAGGLDRVSHRFSFVRSEIVEHGDVVALEGRDQELFDVGEKPLAVDGAVRQGASMRSLRRAARKVAVFQWPCGTLATSRSPRRAQPWRRVMLVLVQVSSMKTRREGSTRF
jgi:hypothetical protein